MKKLFLGLFVLLALVPITLGGFYYGKKNAIQALYAQLGQEAPTLTQDNYSFRDLNKNGKLDPYEDARVPTEERVENLLQQMTLEEKAGTLFITMVGMTPEGNPLDLPLISTNPMEVAFSFILAPNIELVIEKSMNHFNIVNSYTADVLAKYNNEIQKIAERTRLGIPVTIASDPRHASEQNPGAAIYTPSFSQWPSPLGLAATRDTSLVREFGHLAREEYKAVGIRVALHPMADLATEPRWGRINGTFGEDAGLSAAMSYAYIKGFQGDTLSKESVICMTKHFSGGGPQKDGEDAHFPYGSEQVYPGNNFDYHLRPFVEGALPAHTGQIMPYYGIPVGQTDEEVAFGFNKQIITTLLRDSLKYDGVVCTDWNIISKGGLGDPRAWGVEHLSESERVLKVLNAGCDQFGGESNSQLVIDLVKEGKISEERIDVSVRRLLRDKFTLGLFDQPYVDEKAALSKVSVPEAVEKAHTAQLKSVVLLKNEGVLPLQKNIKIKLDGFLNPDAFTPFATLVDKAEDADVVLVKKQTPFDPRSDYFLEQFFHQGRLHFTAEELENVTEYASKKPVVSIVNLERGAILTALADLSQGLMVEFGSSEKALAELLFGLTEPTGKLPLELPRSMEAVEAQKEDVPYDSKDPLYRFGHGLNYSK